MNSTNCTPSRFNTAPDCVGMDTRDISPLCQRAGDISDSEIKCIGFVSLLLRMCRPTHIPNFIMTTVVDAIQRMFWSRALANVSKKFFKRLKMKFNAAPAISGIVFIRSRLATQFSPHVRSKFSCVSSPVRGILLPHFVVLTLLAIVRVITIQSGRRKNVKHSALASAQPHRLPTVAQPYICNNEPCIDLLPSQIFEIAARGMMIQVNRCKIKIRHFNLLYRLKCLGSLALFTPARRTAFIIPFVLLFCAVNLRAQCINDNPSDPCVSVHTSTLDKAKHIVDRLKAAEAVIVAFEKERVMTDNERKAWLGFKDAAEQTVAMLQKGIADRSRVIELQQKVIETLGQLVEKLEKQVNKKQSAWQKLLTLVKNVFLITTGVTLGRGL